MMDALQGLGTVAPDRQTAQQGDAATMLQFPGHIGDAGGEVAWVFGPGMRWSG